MRNLVGGLVAVLLGACNDSPPPPAFCGAIGSGREDVPARAQASNLLALNLEASLAAKGGNVFFSPYSLSVALGMLYAGANGSSATALAKTAGFDPSADVTGLGFAQLACALAEDAAQGGNDLTVADAIFAQRGKTLLPSFLSTLRDHYDAPATLVDFGNPSAAAQTIDTWVAQATQGTIPMLLSPGDIDPGVTQLVLVNAVYFHGSWASAFDPKATADWPFTTEAGQVVQVPTMNTRLMAGLAGGGSLTDPTALELPYQGSTSKASATLALDVILPPLNQSLAAFERDLTVTALNDLLGRLVTQSVFVSMPKLTFDPRYDLKDALIGLGMGPLFDGNQADLSGVDGARDLFVQWVIQQAHLVVDETGTVASAATGVGGGTLSVEPSLVVNRPFLLILRDVPTGAFLFYGRVADPSQP